MELILKQAIEIPLTILKSHPISEGMEEHLMILMFHKEIISPASLFVLEM
jgi:hypothetical protein